MNKVQPIRDVAKIEEMKNVLKKSSYRDYFLFVFGINTGLRITDILDLRVKDVKNKNYLTLKEGKTNKAKTLLINDTLKYEIQKYIIGMNDQDYLFPSQKGGHIGRVRAYEILKKASNEIGIENVGTHTLRKTFGYWHYKKYKDIAILQEIFNHSSPSITLRYIGITQEEIDNTMREFGL